MRNFIGTDQTDPQPCDPVAEHARRQGVFCSDHLYLVGFLVCRGHEIRSLSREAKRISFEFRDTHELLEDVAGFMSGAVVPARQYSFELLKLKRMLHGGQSR